MMMHKLSLLVCLLLFSLGSIAQENLNNYKYILVPTQYEFQKRPDSYDINSLHKFLFEKAGFEALFSDESYPNDLVDDRCLALTSKLVSNPSMFTTRLTVELYDCYNKLVYSSDEGTSRIKDYKKAYHESLRLAMAELVETGHNFEPNTNNASVKEEVVATSTTVVASKIEPAKKSAENQVKETTLVIEEEAKEVAQDLTKVAVPVAVVAVEETQKDELAKVEAPSIEGTYNIEMWGVCKIVKKGSDYAVIGGDEDFEFASIKPTSNPSIFMIKKTGFKQVQILELDADGNIKVDTSNGFKTYKKVN